MKGSLYCFLIVAFAMMGFVSCQTEEGKIRMVAQKYLDATGCYDVESACLYCTEETANGLRQIDSTLMRVVDSSTIKQNTPAKIKITAINVESDTSAVVSYHKSTPVNDFDGTINMRFRDGRWLAHMPAHVPSLLTKKHHDFSYDSVGPLQELKK